jgi:hypothetical protein
VLGMGTTDGAKSWKLDTFPAGSGPLDSVSCVGHATCWAVGGSSTATVIAESGGAKWETQGLPQSPPRSALTLDAVFCSTRSACWSLGTQTTGHPVILDARAH